MVSQTALAWGINPGLQSELEKAWLYVGRFMWAFAIVESRIDEVLNRIFNLGDITGLILLNDLDIRKKVNLIMVGLSHSECEGMREYKKSVKEMQGLITIRNIIAHCSFSGPESDGTIHFEHVTTRDRLKFPDPDPQVRKKQKLPQSDYTLLEFDEMDDKMRKLYIALNDILGSCKPITEFDSDLENEVAETVRYSGNGQQFPTEDEDE